MIEFQKLSPQCITMNRYLLRAALILAKTFYLLLAGVSIFAGVENAQTLWLASASQAGFVQAAGTIDAVIKHDDPNYEGVGKPTFVAEVKFSYPAAGGRLASNTPVAAVHLVHPGRGSGRHRVSAFTARAWHQSGGACKARRAIGLLSQAGQLGRPLDAAGIHAALAGPGARLPVCPPPRVFTEVAVMGPSPAAA